MTDRESPRAGAPHVNAPQRDIENHEVRLIREGKLVPLHDYVTLLNVSRQQEILLSSCNSHVQALASILAAYPTAPTLEYVRIPGLADTLAPPQRSIPESKSCGFCEAGYPVDDGQHFAGGELHTCSNNLLVHARAELTGLQDVARMVLNCIDIESPLRAGDVEVEQLRAVLPKESPTERLAPARVIRVNGRPVEWHAREISAEQLEILAFAAVREPGARYTISYEHGHRDSSGHIAWGESIRTEPGMVFNVVFTGRA